MPNDTQPFEAMTRLEEAILKSRGLNYLLSRFVHLMDGESGPGDLNACAIQALSDAVTDEVGTRFKEASRAVIKPAAVQPAKTPNKAA